MADDDIDVFEDFHDDHIDVHHQMEDIDVHQRMEEIRRFLERIRRHPTSPHNPDCYLVALKSSSPALPPPIPDWCSLPADAAHYLSTRLVYDVDYFRFRSVCTAWRSAAPRKPHPQLPWVISFYSAEQDRSRTLSISIFPDTNRLFAVPQSPEEKNREKFVCGSSRGWIALLDDAPGITLTNPFTEARIRLPTIDSFPEDFRGETVKKTAEGFAHYNRDGNLAHLPDSGVHPFSWYSTFLVNKVTLSSHPLNDDCVVMALCYCGGRLIYCRPREGSSSWSALSPVFHQHFFTDIIFFRGEILPANPLFSDGEPRDEPSRSYLVVSAGNLLLVGVDYSTICQVFRVDMFGWELMRLHKMDNLGGRALFLGVHCMSVSVVAGNSACCKGNCIYYSAGDRAFTGGDDGVINEFSINIFNMEDGTTSMYTRHLDNPVGTEWLMPSLC